MTYQVISAFAAVTPRRRKLDWPIDQLDVGQAFIVPMVDGTDPEGRPESYMRVIVSKQGARLKRTFACNKVQDGLAISRIA
ncbi:MAG: hypothetical protein RLZZ515_637 [Cyanobacteriota bacterium]|jgi:hypothetical protein